MSRETAKAGVLLELVPDVGAALAVLAALTFAALPGSTPGGRLPLTAFVLGESLMFLFAGFGWRLCGRIAASWVVFGVRFMLLFAIFVAYGIALSDTGRQWSWTGEFVPVSTLLALSVVLPIGSAVALWLVEIAATAP